MAPPPTGRPLREVADNPRLISPPHKMSTGETLTLTSGMSLQGLTVSFETYGTLSARRDNAILVCHSLTKGAHAAGRHASWDRRTGWWDAAIGPGKMLDTNTYFVICSDALAAGSSTGPASTNPVTARPYGLDFPVITVQDMVRVQRRLADYLGITRLHAVIGGCLGGQQALEWARCDPRGTRNAIVITTTPATSAHSIAIFAVMRRLIRADPDWNGGDYYGRAVPHAGLGHAVSAALPLWMSREAMDARFGRRTAAPGDYSYSLDSEFEVETFLDKVAGNAGQEIDPNGLMYLMRAVEYFDLERSYGSLKRAMADVRARLLFVSYNGDWRYPSADTERLHMALRAAGGNSRHVVLDSPLGHGAFLYDLDGLADATAAFLAGDWPPAGPLARAPA